MLFSEILKDYNWEEMGKSIYAKTSRDVERALAKAQTPGEEIDLEDFKALVSPAALQGPYLETMAGLSRTATQKKFGKTIQFYIPLYLSNACTNHCIYCGFNHENKFTRVTLSDEQIMEECKVLKDMGYEHILLLTGESPKDAGIDYVIVRAAYRGYETGKIVPDDLYEQNIRGAADVGLHVGVYLYSQALSEHEAEEEADYLLSLIEGLPVDYPVVYDQEEYTADKARTDGLTGEQATLNALAFCRRVHEAGYIPMIYTNNDWATTMYDMERLDHYPVWYADYTSTPTLPGGFAMWQYTDSGQVPGITGPVDLNLLFLPIP